MSYILEALKQSQRERDLGSVPTPAAGPPSAAPVTEARANFWVLLAVGTAMLAVVIALFALLQPRWFGQIPAAREAGITAPTGSRLPVSNGRGRMTEGPAAVKSQALAEPSPAGIAQAAPGGGPGGLSPPMASEPAPLAPVRSAEPELVEPEVPVEPSQVIRQETEALRKRLLELALQTPDVKPEPEPPLAADPQTPALKPPALAATTPLAYPAATALPLEVQRALPERRILVHVYNPRPDKRFVVVNSQRLTEGGSAADGLLLQEIRPDGVVFGFQGHSFFEPR